MHAKGEEKKKYFYCDKGSEKREPFYILALYHQKEYHAKEKKKNHIYTLAIDVLKCSIHFND